MTASIIGGRSRPRRRNQRTTGQRTRPAAATPIGVADAAFVTNGIVVTFDQPVMLSGVPAYRLEGGQLPTAAVRVSPTSVQVTYPAGASLGSVTIPADDPAVTNNTGGRVNGGTLTVTAERQQMFTQPAASEPVPALKAA